MFYCWIPIKYVLLLRDFDILCLWYVFLPVKAAFQRSENVFFNESFIPASGIRIFVLWKQYSFIYRFSFFLRKPLLVLKSVSTSPNEGCSWNIVSTRRNKNYHRQEFLKNREKISFHQPENQLSTSNNKLLLWKRLPH